MRIGLGQINTTVGDLQGNVERILASARQAQAQECELFLAPELAVTGYPPQDLLFKRHFVTEQLRLVQEQLAPTLPLPGIVGFVDRDADGKLYNAAACITGGRVERIVHKSLLPTYDVFDEWRYFRPGRDNSPVELAGKPLGVTICEDIWDDPYELKTVPRLVEQGAEMIINLSSSPFHAGKREQRLALLRRHALAHKVPVIYCNLVGAQDELIFDGESMAMDGRGRLVALGPQFAEKLVVVNCCPERGAAPAVVLPGFHREREVFAALTLGLRDYCAKCGFRRVVLGLSGGVDSALVACLAAHALGPAQVIAVAMPGEFTASMSNEDAQTLAANLNIEFHTMPIQDSIVLAKRRYVQQFGEYREGITVENLQARERGKLLMEISNDQHALVLATGNKTEYALGYSTLYGDMCGGLAVIGDVSKPEVYALASYYNTFRGREIIPRRILTRPPSAELRADQVDPFDYSRISPLTDAVVEDHLSPEELLQQGYTAAEIATVMKLVRLNEYKRKQAPPILRVTEKAFGIGRRMPIVNKFCC